jgi:REP element-mobilizing transposase RayT
MARPNRVKLSGEGFYHVIDRIAHREFLLKDEQIKRRLVDLMHRAAEFSGVDVCTYVVMDNHLHLCVHVPEPEEVDEGTVVERVGALYGEARAAELRGELERLRAEGREDDAIRVLDRLRARMGDLSEFMKTFKQRVTQWYNRELGHEGTLWSGRFKSVLLDKDYAVRVVANYIHANPVRARMVEAADGYRWSGLGAAVQGDKRAIRGLSVIGMKGLSPEVSTKGGSVILARDPRLVNGLIVGGVGFVLEMAGRLRAKFRGSPTLQKIGMSLYASHGGRSAPRQVA